MITFILHYFIISNTVIRWREDMGDGGEERVNEGGRKGMRDIAKARGKEQ